MKLLQGDCLEQMKLLPENSVDSIVTDPPYGLSFMGKKWDYDVPSIELWKECLRVVKPGGFLLSFAGTRTYHRMAINIEDAGFEIRDMISWLYGSGFPKSLNVGKQVDKIQGNEREVTGEKVRGDVEKAKQNGVTFAKAEANKNNKDIFGYGKEILTKGNSEWEGWGTALKPACEPIVVARKPLSEKNVALNVLKWGTGGINIDGCRIPTNPEVDDMLRSVDRNKRESETWEKGSGFKNENNSLTGVRPEGRFPANIILNEEAVKILDEQTGELGKSQGGRANQTTSDKYGDYANKFEKRDPGFGDKGGASRFFYCAKASKSERNLGCEDFRAKAKCEIDKMGGEKCSMKTGSGNERNVAYKNNHPTVKPIKLMQYLVRLVTPKGGVCLDPFLGSGTTACACIKEGVNYIGIEKEEDYINIAKARIKAVEKRTKMDALQKDVAGVKNE